VTEAEYQGGNSWTERNVIDEHLGKANVGDVGAGKAKAPDRPGDHGDVGVDRQVLSTSPWHTWQTEPLIHK
jgi:hypothetical protein